MTNPERSVALMQIAGPIMLGTAFQIETAQTKACCAAFLTWLQRGILGGLIIGLSRHGKSCAVRWAMKAVGKALNIRIPFFEIPLRSYDKPNANEFFEHLLKEIGHRNWMKGKTSQKRNRLIDFLAARARTCPIKTVFLYFDEAQYLSDMHWTWIHNIANEAAVRKIKIFFLFSGPYELEELKERYVQAGRSHDHLVGRFMNSVFYLTGLESVEELGECLKGFSEVVYPKSKDVVLVENFVDPKVRPGFSLPSYASAMWGEFEQILAAEVPEAPAAEMVLPMHYVTAAVLQFLTGLATNEEGRSDEVLLKEAVRACGFSDFTRSSAFRSEELAKAA